MTANSSEIPGTTSPTLKICSSKRLDSIQVSIVTRPTCSSFAAAPMLIILPHWPESDAKPPIYAMLPARPLPLLDPLRNSSLEIRFIASLS